METTVKYNGKIYDWQQELCSLRSLLITGIVDDIENHFQLKRIEITQHTPVAKLLYISGHYSYAQNVKTSMIRCVAVERLVSLGIMGDQLRTTLGFQEGPNLGSLDAEIDASLSDSYVRLIVVVFPVWSHAARTEKSFRNLIKSNRNQIAFTIFRLIWNKRTAVWFQINRNMISTI